MQRLSRGLLAYPRFTRSFADDAQILDSKFPSEQRSRIHKHFRSSHPNAEKPIDTSSHVIIKNLLEKCIKPQSHTPEAIQAFRAHNGVQVLGKDTPDPLFSFSDMVLPKSVSDAIIQAGIEKPSPIQSEAIPIALSGRDMIGIAETGSGKTLSFLLPGISHITHQYYYNSRAHRGPYALILAPTRELALQISEECRKYIVNTNLYYACVYGGAPRDKQQFYLSRTIHFLVATPGRLIDFINSKDTRLNLVSYVVLDEADRMLDMGFEPQIRTILENIREDRQTLMFSATWPREVRNLASDFLTDPLQVQIGSLELTANKNITQVIEFVNHEDKQRKLLEFIKGLKDDAKVLIFTETKAYCEKLGNILDSNDIDVEVLHGDKNQVQRVRSLGRFKDNHVNIMIATDVASRGLDVKNIDYVINYDMPENIDSYIHRIGRTGRAGNKGTAISYFTEQDKGIARELVKVLKDADQHVPEDLKKVFEMKFSSTPNRRGSSRGNNRSRSQSSYSYENQQSRQPRYIRDIRSNPSSQFSRENSDRYSSVDLHTDSSKERRFSNSSRRRSSFDTDNQE